MENHSLFKRPVGIRTEKENNNNTNTTYNKLERNDLTVLIATIGISLSLSLLNVVHVTLIKVNLVKSAKCV